MIHIKRVLATAVLAMLFIGAVAQKLEKAKDKLKDKKYDEAKSEIDAFLAIEKNAKNADAWYTKAKIYNAIAASDPSKAPSARQEAFAALRKYFEYDDKLLIALQIDKYEPLNSIYQAYYKEGADDFNAKKYEEAITAFRNAIEVNRFMMEKKLINSAIDTSSTLYAGVSAERLEKPDTAAVYYSRLADLKISKFGDGDFSTLYSWLARHYYQKKEFDKADKYIAIGRKLYPTNPFWSAMEVEMAKSNPDKQVLFNKYQDLVTRYPDSTTYLFDYSVEMYNYAYDTSTTGKRPENSAALIEKALANAKTVTTKRADFAQAQLLVGQIIYNQGVDSLNNARRVKGSKPEDIKRRNDSKAQAIKKFDEAAPYFLEVDRILGSQGKLKPDEKRVLKDAYDLLITVYDQKGLKDKVKEFEVKFNDVDRVH